MRGRESRALPRARRTCAAGSGTGARSTGCATRRARAAFSSRNPLKRLFELCEHALGCVVHDRRDRIGAKPLTQLLVAEVAADGLGERLAVTERDEQPVHAVADDLGDTAGRRCEYRRSGGEGLDNRVREVLPAGRENRRVGRSEELDHTLARLGAQEAHAALEPELGDIALERRPLVPLTGDEERDALVRRERLERNAKRLLRGEPPGE